jgi:hypothetical protein
MKHNDGTRIVFFVSVFWGGLINKNVDGETFLIGQFLAAGRQKSARQFV